VTDCRFEYNQAGDRGGGAGFSVNCFPEIHDSIFHHNSAGNGGGLIFVYAYGPVVGCVFSENTGSYGGGMQCYGNAQATVTSCTFSGNTSIEGSGIYFRNNSSPTIENSIFGFGAMGGAFARFADDCNPTFSCTDVYGNNGGDWDGFTAPHMGQLGNMSSDPLFCDPAGGDFALNVVSPCLPGFNDCGALIGAREQGCEMVGVPDPGTQPITRLLQNRPNPMGSRTTIGWELEREGRVSIEVFDVTGRLVRRLLDEVPFSAGEQRTDWDARDDHGQAVAGGIYFYRLRTGGIILTRRLVVVR
jgi:hypothetical protein